MKVTLISDLHLEFADLVLPGGDVLIIAGDLCEAKSIKKNMYDSDTELTQFAFEDSQKRPDRFYRFILEECSAKYRETIMVMGNHEHYGYRLEKTADYIRSQLPDNVVLLDNDRHVIDGVLFLGSTMWTDINRNDPVTHQTLAYAMSDYRYITQQNPVNNSYHKLTTQRTRHEHLKTVAYFEKSLQENRTGDKLPVVVVSHHAPSTLSISPEFQDNDKMNGGYCSDLSGMILDYPEIQVWVHGHTHDFFDYKLGDTRVLCNPRGYHGYEIRAKEFDPGFTFEVTGAI